MKILFYKNSKKSFVYFLLILLLISGADFVFFIVNNKVGTAFYEIISVFALLLLPLIIFRNHLRLYAWLLLPIVIFVPVTIACMKWYFVPINDSIVIITLNTNMQESLELVRGYIFPFILIMCSCLFCYLIFLSKTPKQISFKKSAIISSGSLLLILSLPFIKGREDNYLKQLRGIYYSVYPTSFFYCVSKVYNQYRIIDLSTKHRANFKFNAVQSPAVSKQQVYVLVLGESSRYDHWGINGYARNTSPNLAKRENFISFSNTNTNAYITEYAVPLILTGVSPEKFDQNYQQKSIVGAFNEAGFNSYWISGQIDDGHIRIHIQDAVNKYLLLQSSKSTKNIHRDEELLSKFATVLNEPGDKKFIVLHLQGSHYDYSVRYPDAFDKFQPSNKTIASQSTDYKSKDLIVNSYDNSILYSDYILDSVISLVKSKPIISSVFYISDHGENLFDDSRHLSQHAYPEPSKYIAHVPFFVWYSDSLQKLTPKKIEALQQNRNKQSSAQNLFYTYTDICGIKIPGIDPLKSLCNKNFIEMPRNILGGEFKIYNADLLH